MEVEKGHSEVLDHRPLKEDLQIDQQDKEAREFAAEIRYYRQAQQLKEKRQSEKGELFTHA
jgi:hypothetical protein